MWIVVAAPTVTRTTGNIVKPLVHVEHFAILLLLYQADYQLVYAGKF